MPMLRYTFADLLHVFFALRLPSNEIRTYEQLATALQVSRRAVAGWFAADYTPRSPDIIVRLGEVLDLIPLETDLLLYAVNPKWVRFGTPVKVLAAYEIVRYREHLVPAVVPVERTPPSIAELEHTWTVVFEDTFADNYRQWGLGVKDDGLCVIERSIVERHLILTLHNRFSGIAFLGADSSCFAPPTYYMTVKAQLVEAQTEDDGYAFIFEEISDNCHAVFRIRERLQQVSVVQTFDGTTGFDIHINRVPAPSICVGAINKLAVLAIDDQHWFYINDALIATCAIARFPCSRLDLGVAAGRNQIATCSFQHFCVRVPPTSAPYAESAHVTSVG